MVLAYSKPLSYIPAVLLALFMLVSAALAESPEEIAAQRQYLIGSILHKKSAESVATQRWVCAMGEEAADVREGRAEGDSFLPDASAACVAALLRTGRDGNLQSLYVKLLGKWGGDATLAARLPRIIGKKTLDGSADIPAGNGRAGEATQSLAFDAGFTSAWQDGSTASISSIDNGKLKSLAEMCLAQKGELGVCFSVGYAYGASAVKESRP